jgi:hypothetical protein
VVKALHVVSVPTNTMQYSNESAERRERCFGYRYHLPICLVASHSLHYRSVSHRKPSALVVFWIAIAKESIRWTVALPCKGTACRV